MADNNEGESAAGEALTLRVKDQGGEEMCFKVGDRLDPIILVDNYSNV